MNIFRSFSLIWFPFMAGLMIKGSLLLALAFLLHSARRRASAAQQHLIWASAVLSVLSLPLFSVISARWDLSIQILARAEARNVLSPAAGLPRDRTVSWGLGDGNLLKREPLPGDVERQPAGSSSSRPSFLSGFLGRTSWPQGLALIWMAGMTALSARALADALRARRRKDDRPLADDPVFGIQGREISFRFGIRRSCRVIARRCWTMPSTRGILRPTIILPEDAGRWPSDRKRSVLIHEMAHIQRWDHPVNVLAHVARLIFWPNPLVWIAVRKMRRDAELACDDRVIAQGVRPTAYARILIDFARCLASHSRGPLIETAMARKAALEERLLSLIDERRPRTKPGRKTAIFSWILSAAVVFLVACTEVREKNYTIEIVDGVPHIHNISPKWEKGRTVDLEFVRKIGDPDETDRQKQFFNAIDAAIDGPGNIYVLDAGNYRIQVFDSQGGYLRTIGRKGQGPGDFENGFSLDIADNGDLFVLDRIKRSVDRFDPRGLFVARTRLSYDFSYLRLGGGESFFAPLVDVRYPVSVYKSLRFFINADDQGSAEARNCLAAVRLADGTAREFCPGIPEQAGLDAGRQINANVLEKDREGNLVVAFKYQNRIDKYTPDGRRLLTIDRPLNFPVEHKTGDRLWRSGRIGMMRPEFRGTFVSERLGIDGRGRIWVVTYTDQPVIDEEGNLVESGGKIFEVFDAEGILLTRVPYPDARFLFLRMRGDRLLFGDEDFLTIHQYRIIKP